MSDGLEVDKAGLVVGWKLVALVMVSVLGLYVSQIIAPLRDDVLMIKETHKHLTSTLNRLTEKVDKMANGDTVAHTSVDVLKSEVKVIQKNMDSLNAEQREIRKRVNRFYSSRQSGDK